MKIRIVLAVAGMTLRSFALKAREVKAGRFKDRELGWTEVRSYCFRLGPFFQRAQRSREPWMNPMT
jgi:hypothetical protein